MIRKTKRKFMAIPLLCCVTAGVFIIFAVVGVFYPVVSEVRMGGGMENSSTLGKLSSRTPRPSDKRMFYAAGRGDSQLVKKLIHDGVDVNQKDEKGLTPLHIAVTNGEKDSETVRLLLKAGANSNAPDATGTTPLVRTIGPGGTADDVRILLDNGADPNRSDNFGTTPLIAAAGWVMPGVAEMLLSKGANPNIVDGRGNSSLMTAAIGGTERVEIVRVLIEKGADVHLRNAKGETALMIAEAKLRHYEKVNESVKKSLLEIIAELKKAGASERP